MQRKSWKRKASLNKQQVPLVVVVVVDSASESNSVILDSKRRDSISSASLVAHF